MSRYAAHASSKGGTTAARLPPDAEMIAPFTAAIGALGNKDRKRAIVPVTNGAAALVPPEAGRLLKVRLMIPSPGALNPRRPIDFPRFE